MPSSSGASKESWHTWTWSPRDEFDAVKEMAARARSEAEALAERVAQLEARLAAAEAAPQAGAGEAGDGR